ncbi:hypothetical protein [Azospirillum soli]|uniref:hypothetical protein n=1 Tax=Azospirillum soli TaxID=1304799 RepID=UPI001FE88D70|nr:hypothetical protein [Azospirillum soli]MBP2316072.1 5-methylcytosine-specific restriction endonuclease McrA [Azospirillum soli]
MSSSSLSNPASGSLLPVEFQPRLRWRRPVDWARISHEVRFVRAKGRCECCARPHGHEVRCLPDGRWFDVEAHTWRDARGKAAPWPDVVDYARHRTTRVILATCHRDHDPANLRPANLVALCQRCHLEHDRAEHRRRFRVTILMRRALGDLFHGPYGWL